MDVGGHLVHPSFGHAGRPPDAGGANCAPVDSLRAAGAVEAITRTGSNDTLDIRSRRSLAIHHCSVANAIPRCRAKRFCVSWLRSNSAIVETQNSRPRRIGPARISYASANRHAPFPGRIRYTSNSTILENLSQTTWPNEAHVPAACVSDVTLVGDAFAIDRLCRNDSGRAHPVHQRRPIMEPARSKAPGAVPTAPADRPSASAGP